MVVAITFVPHSTSLDRRGPNGLPLSDAIARPWEWQPGSSYEYEPE